MKRKMAETGAASSGNVFADLGLPEPAVALAKAALAHRIVETIAARRLTQAAAARVLGVDQPKVSRLVRGDLAGLSTDRLLRFLSALGRDVEIVVRPARRTRRPGQLRVRAA